MWLSCLPWYDLHELRSATDALWLRIAENLRASGIKHVPKHLNRSLHYEDQWDSGNLLLGQACGYDVALAFADRLRVVSAPEFDLDGCEGATYRSFVVVREDNPVTSIQDLRGLRCVINTPTSHSGMNVLRALVAPLSEDGYFFKSVEISGAHERSLELLHHQKADVAAIDCITYGLLKRVRPQALEGIRVIHQTNTVAAPPFVTSQNTSEATIGALREAIKAALPLPELALISTTPIRLRDYAPIAQSARHDMLQFRA
jgi:ABC-type phosphate/phosphonate transport system substrate-binding protein